MKTFLKVVVGLVMGLAGLVAVAVVGLYATSEVLMRGHAPKADVRLTAATDAGAVARGARLAHVYGCNDCHGADLRGRQFFNEPGVGRISGQNLTLAAAHQSDADLARAIRTGVGSDGRKLWIMPSEAFARLDDAETAALIAYIRSRPSGGERLHALDIGPIGRVGLVLGKFPSAPDKVAAAAGHDLPDFGPQFAQGRRLARACTECHGVDLKGQASVKAPDLNIASAYDEAGFERLLRTGVGREGRRLGLMSETAPVRFDVWSHEDIAALYAYLQARTAAS